MNKTTLYAYINPKNKAYLEKLSLTTGQSSSYCIDAILDALRLSKDLNIEAKRPSALERLDRMKQKKKDKIKTLQKR